MKPEEWHQGMKHEAESVPDGQWARETRWAAWWAGRIYELRQVLTRKPLGELLLVLLLPYLILLPGLDRVGNIYGQGVFLLPFGLLAGLNAGGATLFLLLWTARYAWSDRAPWVLAVTASAMTLGLMPLALALVQLRVQGAAPALSPARVMGGTMVLLAVLWAFAWAIQVLKHSKVRRKA